MQASACESERLAGQGIVALRVRENAPGAAVGRLSSGRPLVARNNRRASLIMGLALGPADREVAVLALAIGLDALCGEPPNQWHPVAIAGRLIAAADRRAPVLPFAALAYGTVVALGG